VEAGAERDGALFGVDLGLAERSIVVGGDDDVHVLDRAAEVLEQRLLVDLELEQGTVDLVDHADGLDPLRERLAEDSLRLHADTVDGVDDDEGAVGDTERGGNLGREVDVSGRVDQVDQEVLA
jgi:hypothetical protein